MDPTLFWTQTEERRIAPTAPGRRVQACKTGGMFIAPIEVPVKPVPTVTCKLQSSYVQTSRNKSLNLK
jgi:hypothetical protein